eukprot:scaffold27748_cov72-Phaeocystis_antarctica.AAC.2
MRWTSTRPTRPSVMQNASTLKRGHRSVGAESAVQPMRGRLRAIRKTWHGKAMRKSCVAQADSCEASAKAPVKGFIAMLAAAASRSGHGFGSCSLRGALESRSMAAVDVWTRLQKSCDAQAVSRVGSAKAPVMRCMLAAAAGCAAVSRLALGPAAAAAAASRSGSSLRRVSAARSHGIERRDDQLTTRHRDS